MSEGSFVLERKELSEREGLLEVHWHFRVRKNNCLLLQRYVKPCPLSGYRFPMYGRNSLEESFKYRCDTEILCAKS